MFDKDSPSESLDVLLCKLKSEHQEGHIYRGQMKFYDISVPYARRPYIDSGWVVIPAWDVRLSLWSIIMATKKKDCLLAKYFNRGRTNFLAQQCGFSSDIFDVTFSIDVEAFFTTKSWPTVADEFPSDLFKMPF